MFGKGIGNQMKPLFMSHVEEDQCVAFTLADALDSLGYPTWLYERDSLPLRSYLLNTQEAIDQCRAFILVVTRQSMTSHQIDVEIECAHERAKPILPVLIGVTDAEYKRRKPIWRQVVGTATSIAIVDGNEKFVAGRIADGLKAEGVSPGAAPVQKVPKSVPVDHDVSSALIKQHPFLANKSEIPERCVTKGWMPVLKRTGTSPEDREYKRDGVAVYLDVGPPVGGRVASPGTNDAVRTALQRAPGNPIVCEEQSLLVYPDAVTALTAVRTVFADALLSIVDHDASSNLIVGMGTGSYSLAGDKIGGEAPHRAVNAATDPLVRHMKIKHAIVLARELFGLLSDRERQRFGIVTLHHAQLDKRLYSMDISSDRDDSEDPSAVIKRPLLDLSDVYMLAMWIPRAKLKKEASSEDIKARMSSVVNARLLPALRAQLVDVAIPPRLLLFRERDSALAAATALLRETADSHTWDDTLDVNVGIALHTGGVTMDGDTFSGPDIQATSDLVAAAVPDAAIVLSKAMYAKLDETSEIRLRAVSIVDRKFGEVYYCGGGST